MPRRNLIPFALLGRPRPGSPRLRRAGCFVGAERGHADRAERVDGRRSAPRPGRRRSPWTSSTPSRPAPEPGRITQVRLIVYVPPQHMAVYQVDRPVDEADGQYWTRRPSPARSARTRPSSAARRRGPPTGAPTRGPRPSPAYSARVPRTTGHLVRATDHNRARPGPREGGRPVRLPRLRPPDRRRAAPEARQRHRGGPRGRGRGTGHAPDQRHAHAGRSARDRGRMLRRAPGPRPAARAAWPRCGRGGTRRRRS